MHHFTSLNEIASFFYDNYYHFLRYDDRTVEYDGITYIMDFTKNSLVPVLKLSYIDTELKAEKVLLCVIAFGLVVNTSDSENSTDIFEYVDIIKEDLFGLNLFDLVKFNTIFERYKSDINS